MIPLSRRENEILDCVYKLGRPTAKEVMHALDDGASYSTIRTLLNNLAEKGWVEREEQGLKYIYVPKLGRDAAARNAMKRLVSTFFEDSPIQAVNSFLNMHQGTFSEEEIEQLERFLNKKRSELKEK